MTQKATTGDASLKRAPEDHAEGATCSDGNNGGGEKDERCQRPTSWRSSSFS
eukprot:gene10023-5792_t